MDIDIHDDTLNYDDFRIYSRREVVNILRSLEKHTRLVRMHANGGQDSALTSILGVDDTNGTVIVDRAPSAVTHDRLLASQNIQFDTALENIRILFSAPYAQSVTHEGRAALAIPLPESIVRLQRREYYRIQVPVSTPVSCTLMTPDDPPESVTVTLYNVSVGGIAVVDDKKIVKREHMFTEFPNCRLDLPGGAITVTLRLQNMQEISLTNGKKIQRLGFMFMNPSNAVGNAIQRYITKLERDLNSMKTGMR